MVTLRKTQEATHTSLLPPYRSGSEVPVVDHAGGDDAQVTMVTGVTVVPAGEVTQPRFGLGQTDLPGATCTQTQSNGRAHRNTHKKRHL